MHGWLPPSACTSAALSTHLTVRAVRAWLPLNPAPPPGGHHLRRVARRQADRHHRPRPGGGGHGHLRPPHRLLHRPQGRWAGALCCPAGLIRGGRAETCAQPGHRHAACVAHPHSPPRRCVCHPTRCAAGRPWLPRVPAAGRRQVAARQGDGAHRRGAARAALCSLCSLCCRRAGARSRRCAVPPTAGRRPDCKRPLSRACSCLFPLPLPSTTRARCSRPATCAPPLTTLSTRS